MFLGALKGCTVQLTRHTNPGVSRHRAAGRAPGCVQLVPTSTWVLTHNAGCAKHLAHGWMPGGRAWWNSRSAEQMSRRSRHCMAGAQPRVKGGSRIAEARKMPQRAARARGDVDPLNTTAFRLVAAWIARHNMCAVLLRALQLLMASSKRAVGIVALPPPGSLQWPICLPGESSINVKAKCNSPTHLQLLMLSPRPGWCTSLPTGRRRSSDPSANQVACSPHILPDEKYCAGICAGFGGRDSPLPAAAQAALQLVARAVPGRSQRRVNNKNKLEG